MQAIDFVLYCAGLGLLLLSGAGAIKLVRVDSKSPAPSPPSPPEPTAEIGGELVDRLHAFQQQRFATPLFRRQLDRENYEPTPGEPGGRRVVPPIRTPQRQPAPKRKGPPPLPKQDTSNVVPFPKKGDTTKKD